MAASPIQALPIIQDTLSGASLLGEGPMRFWGFRVFHARLWVGPEFEPAQFDAFPLALDLTYDLSLSGHAIAERSISEIRHQRPVTKAQAESWLRILAAILPDVKAGDRLVGIYTPDQGLSIWRENACMGEVRDLELARAFIGIWLSPKTSEPKLRSALLSMGPKS